MKRFQCKHFAIFSCYTYNSQKMAIITARRPVRLPRNYQVSYNVLYLLYNICFTFVYWAIKLINTYKSIYIEHLNTPWLSFQIHTWNTLTNIILSFKIIFYPLRVWFISFICVCFNKGYANRRCGFAIDPLCSICGLFGL